MRAAALVTVLMAACTGREQRVSINMPSILVEAQAAGRITNPTATLDFVGAGATYHVDAQAASGANLSLSFSEVPQGRYSIVVRFLANSGSAQNMALLEYREDNVTLVAGDNNNILGQGAWSLPTGGVGDADNDGMSDLTEVLFDLDPGAPWTSIATNYQQDTITGLSSTDMRLLVFADGLDRRGVVNQSIAEVTDIANLTLRTVRDRMYWPGCCLDTNQCTYTCPAAQTYSVGTAAGESVGFGASGGRVFLGYAGLSSLQPAASPIYSLTGWRTARGAVDFTAPWTALAFNHNSNLVVASNGDGNVYFTVYPSNPFPTLPTDGSAIVLDGAMPVDTAPLAIQLLNRCGYDSVAVAFSSATQGELRIISRCPDYGWSGYIAAFPANDAVRTIDHYLAGGTCYIVVGREDSLNQPVISRYVYAGGCGGASSGDVLTQTQMPAGFGRLKAMRVGHFAGYADSQGTPIESLIVADETGKLFARGPMAEFPTFTSGWTQLPALPGAPRPVVGVTTDDNPASTAVPALFVATEHEVLRMP